MSEPEKVSAPENVSAPEQFDVIVVGGGPAGSTLASLVRMKGARVLLLEREVFPRYQIGESLLPATVHGVCRLLGVTDVLAAAGFPVKRGGTFRWGARKQAWTFSFAVSPRVASPTSYAYQVERSKFDKILLDNAVRLGVDVRQGHTVTGIIEAGERVQGVRFTGPDGTEGRATARFVVDASGNTSRLHPNTGGRREYSQYFRSLALFGYFEGGKRLPEPISGNIVSAAFDSGWFWYIPLSSTLTSVGAVVHRSMAEKVQGDPETALNALIKECPMIDDLLENATRVTSGQYGKLRVRKDYSYHNTRFWRPGLILIGDAACFVDPVFSSGVHLATYSALLAARSINSILAGTVAEEPALHEFEARYRREYSVFYEFLTSFYQMNRDEDSYFWEAKRITRSEHYTEFESFVELVAGVASGETALSDAQSMVEHLTKRADELASAVEDVAGGEPGGASAMLRSSVVKQAMHEGSQVQMRALLGEAAVREAPLFPGGLVPSLDSLTWEPSAPA
ncbi:tryptophan 7-halogenase [Dactylosporangium sp. NPDC051541]|uniref:tryptophan 7-halogenase n=1 Tax=Dactylosporangium sp. NPDC051541 TaxID=3363977 RepID=UPI0037A0950C